MPPAVRMSDKVYCLAKVTPAMGKFVKVTGQTANVKIDNEFAVCETDIYTCEGMNPPAPPGSPIPCVTGKVMMGSSTVKIGNQNAARLADMTKCEGGQSIGYICTGSYTVIIGDQGSGGGGGGPSGDGQSGKGESGDAEGTPEPLYSDIQPEPPQPGEPVQNTGVGTHWVSMELVDEAEQPVVGEWYIVRTPDGKERPGALDGHGKAKIAGIKNPGACQIKFPRLDLAAWEKWKAAPSAPPMPPPSPPPTGGSSADTESSGENTRPEDEPVPPGPPARGGVWRKAISGECISSIARDAGHFWQTLWDHASNAKLKQRRRDPNVLLPGDAVWVPDRRPKEETGNTDAHHKFKRKGEPARVRIRLTRNGRPIANAPYRLWIDAEESPGTTDGDGMVTLPARGNARSGKLIVQTPQGEMTFTFALGTVDPIESTRGLQGRLWNLGYYSGDITGVFDEKTRAALCAFQADHDLTVTGEPDTATLQKLFKDYGS